MSRSRSERETIILFNENDGIAEIYTHKKSWINKLDKMCKEFPRDVQVKLFDDYSKTYFISKNLISIRRPRVLTQKQRKEQSVRMAKLRKKQLENQK